MPSHMVWVRLDEGVRLIYFISQTHIYHRYFWNSILSAFIFGFPSMQSIFCVRAEPHVSAYPV